MSKIILRNGRVIGNYAEPYFVAEMGTSHFGKVENAMKMVDAAIEAGCDCVKFQSWTADSLYSKTYYNENRFAKRMVSGFSFSEEQLKVLAAYCKEKGIAFSSTPYSEQEVDFLVDVCDAPYIKVASMDLNNKKFLRYIGNKQIPIILSTGMSIYEEVKKAVEVILETGNEQLCLLHCISVYPPKMEDIRLNNMIELRRLFPMAVIGFSDHSLGCEMANAATAMGAGLIEKHLTLDRSKIGMDNQMCTEPDEMKKMIDGCKNIYNAMGTGERILSEEELQQKQKMRRSVIVTRDVKCGEVLDETFLSAKRPATGIPLEKWDAIIGKKVNRDIEADTVIFENDIIWE